MVSIQTKLLQQVLKFIRLFDISVVDSHTSFQSTKAFLPKRVARLYKTTLQNVNSKSIATVESTDSNPAVHILFFHGGAYKIGMTQFHWSLILKLLERLPCRISIVDYPLAPKYNYKDTFSMIQKLYDLLISQYPDDQFILMGDSAGGGLALAFTQRLLMNEYPVIPNKLVLLSPWLDLTLSNAKIKDVESLDNMLSRDSLLKSGKTYSGGDDMNQYLLSPINGALENLPKTAVFYSTDELFFPDCILLKSKSEQVSAKISFYEYQGMPHDWCIFPIPESGKTVDEICSFLESDHKQK